MIDIAYIRRQAEEIRQMMGDDDDAQTFLDTLDGEADTSDVLTALVQERIEASAVEDAMRAASALYANRAKRHKDKQARLTRLMGEVLDAMGQAKVALPVATVSRTKPRKSVAIVDPNAIPSQLRKWEPDKAAVKAQMDAGETVPGAEWSQGEPGISVRVA